MDIINKITLFRSLNVYPKDVINVICSFTLDCYTDLYVYKHGNMVILLCTNIIYSFSRTRQGTFVFTEKCIDNNVLSEREHIYLKPDLYLGERGIHQIYREALNNAIKSGNNIYIMIDNNTISIKNDGHIPIQMKCGYYLPELIFGLVGGGMFYNNNLMNGLKVVNVFSAHFTVIIFDAITGLKYIQTWFYNALYKSDAIIEAHKGAISSVEIIYQSDFKKFDIDAYSVDMIKSYEEIAKKKSIRTPITFNGNKYG